MVRDMGLDLARRLRAGLVSPRDAAAELSELMGRMYREPPVSRATPASTPMTRQLRDEIKRQWASGRWNSQHRLAAHLDISQGRVSEALTGKWDAL
jgi:hypothetical protein